MHTKRVSDVDSLKQGQIIGVLYGEILDFGIYLGFSSETLAEIQKQVKGPELLYADLNEMRDHIYDRHVPCLYLLGKISMQQGLDTNDLVPRFYDEADIGYIEKKVSGVMLKPFQKERVTYFSQRQPTYVFDLADVNIMKLLLKTSLMDKNLQNLTYYSSQTFRVQIGQHLQDVYDLYSKQYYYFNNLFSICTPISLEETNVGTVYACNKRLKKGDNNLVLMLYVGDEKFVQIGTGHEMVATPASLITEVQRTINNCDFLEKVLTEHKLIELPCGSTIYKIGLDGLTIYDRQYLTYFMKKKIEKAQLTEIFELL